MTFFSVLCALILEQFRALSRDNPIYDVVRALAARAEEWFDTGQRRDAVLAWCVVTLPAVVVVALVHYLLSSISIGLAFLWNVVMVYLTLGFRQFSHYFTDIHEALRGDDVVTARLLLNEWSGLDTTDMPVNEIVRHTLENAIVAAHRHVFGVFFWFLVPIGPAGVVLYRGAEYLARHWSEPSMERSLASSPQLGRLVTWLLAKESTSREEMLERTEMSSMELLPISSSTSSVQLARSEISVRAFLYRFRLVRPVSWAMPSSVEIWLLFAIRVVMRWQVSRGATSVRML